jgi:PPK2 family polyphosphate:nucleotide phosphotransferase
MTSLAAQLATSGPIDVSLLDSRATPGYDGDKDGAPDAMAALGEELADLQERLFAQARVEIGNQRILLVMQGMDTAGKGGVIRKVAGLVDPQGVAVTAFKKPTPEELEHDFLWRIEKALPAAGEIGIFDRSHYEDVLIGRVRELATAEEIERRYDAINAFEQAFVEDGGTIIKCFLHITPDDQEERLAERLDDPTKFWKYNPGDVDERLLWSDYAVAYGIALERCSTEHAPFHVIPSGRKWYRNWAIATILAETLRSMDLQWPEAGFDIDVEKARLADS